MASNIDLSQGRGQLVLALFIKSTKASCTIFELLLAASELMQRGRSAMCRSCAWYESGMYRVYNIQDPNACFDGLKRDQNTCSYGKDNMGSKYRLLAFSVANFTEKILAGCDWRLSKTQYDADLGVCSRSF